MVGDLSAVASAGDKPVPAAPKKDRRTYIAEEILSTELSYVEGLAGLLSAFKIPLQETMQPEEERLLFSNVHILVKFHTYFHSELESRMSSWATNPTIGDVLVQAVPFMKMYTSYVNNYAQVNDLLSSLGRHNHKYVSALQGCAFGSMEGHMGLVSLLLSPIQRIPRYVLLFRDLLKHTPDDHADFDPVTKAYNAVSVMATTINEVKRADEQRTHMRHVLSSLSKECRKKMQRSFGEVQDSFEVLKPDRILLREGVYRVAHVQRPVSVCRCVCVCLYF
jgi:RhoGEF domain